MNDNFTRIMMPVLIFLAGMLAGALLFKSGWSEHDKNLRHILSHVPKEYISEAKEQIDIEKTTGSNAEKHFSEGTKFDVREAKP